MYKQNHMSSIISNILSGYKETLDLSKKMSIQTFKFNKGYWLLVSHDATGLDAVPVPIKIDNAEVRLKKYLGVDDY